jgi:hypothetical protein
MINHLKIMVMHVARIKDQLGEWMTAVDKSKLPGKYKAWIYNNYEHGVLPRVLWPFLIYEVTLTAVEELERLV